MVRFDRSRLLETPDPRRELALSLAEAALDAVDAEKATRAALAELELGSVVLFAFGKASLGMARAAISSLSVLGGIVVALEDAVLPSVLVRRASHPRPAEDAVRVGNEVVQKARTLGAGDEALCLVSGGGSAMLELPKRGVRIEDIDRIAQRLMHAGADIVELNAVRRALSQIKGGGLARSIAPARIVTVVISDVPGHPPELVASGPTCAPCPGPDPRAVLERYALWDGLSSSVQAAVHEPLLLVGPVEVIVAADNQRARRALCELARDRGVPLSDRDGFFAGEAREIGARIVGDHRAWVWGGESTVTVRGAGRGGRNQELVLGAICAGLDRGLLLAFGTDGVDGSSDAAGALVDAAALARARALGLDPARALAENDSHSFFDALGTALHCGPSGTNVADLCVYLP